MPSRECHPPHRAIPSPPDGEAESDLPPVARIHGRTHKSDTVCRALDYINNSTFETICFVLTNVTWDDYDDFQYEIDHPHIIDGKTADSLR